LFLLLYTSEPAAAADGARAQALKFLIPIAQIGSWGSFRQDIAEGYVRGLPLVPKTLRATDEVQQNALLRELVQGSELGYRSAVSPACSLCCCCSAHYLAQDC
jgi:hypothetical protein